MANGPGEAVAAIGQDNRTGQIEVMQRADFNCAAARATATAAAKTATAMATTTTAAERATRGIAVGRKNYLFVGSQGGGSSAAITYALFEVAKLNGVGPQAWLTDTLACIADHKVNRIDEFLPWRYAQV